MSEWQKARKWCKSYIYHVQTDLCIALCLPRYGFVSESIIFFGTRDTKETLWVKTQQIWSQLKEPVLAFWVLVTLTVWTHLMAFVVGMCTASAVESGSHACLGIVSSDRPTVLNYQSDCLSTLFAWILISPNSVLTPSGECVGDGERKCAFVCVCCDAWRACQRACLMYFVRHGSECVECRTRRFCRWYCGCADEVVFVLLAVGMESHTRGPQSPRGHSCWGFSSAQVIASCLCTEVIKRVLK